VVYGEAAGVTECRSGYHSGHRSAGFIYILELKPIVVAIQWALVCTYTGLMNHWIDKRCLKLNLVNL